MALRRSRSPSTPSEGEIVESSSDTKATTSQTSVNDTNIDRNTRTNISAPRSPGSGVRLSRRERSRSRSPYGEPRGEKRRHDEDCEAPRGSRAIPYGRLGSRYEDRSYDRGNSRRHQRSYYDHDRDDGFERSLRYSDDYERRIDKRPRTRSRSPFRDTRKQRQYSGDEREAGCGVGPTPVRGGGRPSTEQSVSERGRPQVIAQNSRQDAEIRGNQVQQASFKIDSASNKYGSDSDNNNNNNNKRTINNVKNSAAASNDTNEQGGISFEPIDEVTLIEQRRKRREAIKAKYRGQATPLLVQALQLGTKTEPASANEDILGANNNASVDSHGASPSDTPGYSPGAQSPADFKVAKDEDLANANMESTDGVDKEEPSAADYDPTLDMREDRMRHDRRHFGCEVSSSAYDETQRSKQEILFPVPNAQQPNMFKAKDPFDMFAEDDDDMFAEESDATKWSSEQPLVVSKPTTAQPQELDMSMMDNWDDPGGYYNVMLGELINGRYHVQQNLGKGMFSSVVRATDSKTGKLVAVKIIRNNDTMRKAGLKEIEILQQLLSADPDDKKHIVRFDRQFDHKGHLCMVFENLSMNLREVLKKFGRDVGINLRAIRAYAQQMFLGLSLLRKCNILHADLKPDNLLVNDTRNLLKVCDLGSASPASENEITPYLVSRFYRAPEIMLGIAYDYAIDVWSVGCTLFELYSGKILFTGRDNNQMLRLIMECRGKLPPKLLRRGTLTHLHFDDLLNFRSVEEDKTTGRLVTRMLDFKKPTRDLKTRLMGKGSKGLSDEEAKELALFIDLLERCLNVNPEKRCSPSEALKHPFIMRTKT